MSDYDKMHAVYQVIDEISDAITVVEIHRTHYEGVKDGGIQIREMAISLHGLFSRLLGMSESHGLREDLLESIKAMKSKVEKLMELTEEVSKDSKEAWNLLEDLRREARDFMAKLGRVGEEEEQAYIDSKSRRKRGGFFKT